VGRFLQNLLSSLAIVGILLVTSAPATVFVDVSDRHLADASDAVVVGSVIDVEVRLGANGSPETVATIAVESAYKGEPESVVTVTEPGGLLEDEGLWIPGVATFRVGERQVLFLSRRNARGTRRTTMLGMGQYRVRLGRSGLVAERSIDEPVIGGDGHRRVPLDALARATRDDTLVAEPLIAEAPTPVTSEFRLMDRPTARWFLPDQGLPILFGLDPRGDRVLGYDASAAALDAALGAWTAVAGSNIELRRGDDVDALPLLCDGVSQIVFNDPFGELGDPRKCSGVLAVGGYCTAGRSEAPTIVNGIEFRRITEGNITFNDGFGKCPFWSAANLSEILTHELGHTIGIDHSSELDDEPSPMLKDATMYYRAHFDGRGASVRPDDMAAVRAVYPGPLGDETDLDADGVDDAEDNCPGDDPDLAFANPAQTDLDGDGLGDLCDPCPNGDTCEQIVASRLRARAKGRGSLVWTGTLGATVSATDASQARLDLLTADGVLITSRAASDSIARAPAAPHGPRRKLKFVGGSARVVIRPGKGGRQQLRLRVRPFALGTAHVELLRASLTLGDAHYVTNLICRPHPRRVLDCRS